MDFTYVYKGVSYSASAAWRTANLTNVFRITNATQTFDIFPDTSRIKIIWKIYVGEPLPADFIQAVGEGLEAAGIY
jgi:hypothetical protein